MKRIIHKRIAIIEEPSAWLFEAAINAKLDELADNKPELVIESITDHTAYIKYTFEEELPEGIADKFEMIGAAYYCRECAYCDFAKNNDGSERRTVKKAYCSHKKGMTHKNDRACEVFYFELATRTGQFSDGGGLPPGAERAIEQLAADHHDDR